MFFEDLSYLYHTRNLQSVIISVELNVVFFSCSLHKLYTSFSGPLFHGASYGTFSPSSHETMDTVSTLCNKRKYEY